jgi:hypothetical protein
MELWLPALAPQVNAHSLWPMLVPVLAGKQPMVVCLENLTQ